MKTESCADHIEEFASHVAEAHSLGDDAEGHLRGCAACQQKVAELQKVAAVFREEALQSPEPGRRLRRAELERSLPGEGRQPPPRWLRPVLAGSVAIMIAISVTWKSPIATDPTIQVNSLPEAPLKESAKAPTMLALRHDLQRGREQSLALSPAGSGIKHYRVRDLERELY